jgi:Flp pilus assembly protein TadD
VRALAATADLLVLDMLAEPDLVRGVVRRAAAGLFTVSEVNDDALAPQAWNPTANVARDPLLRATFLRLVSLSDALQLSAAPLAERYGHLSPRQGVFVNHLWELPPAAARPAGPLRVGWGGSLGHRDDLAAALPGVRAALERHPEATFAVMGHASFRPLLAALPPARVEFRPGGSLAAYHAFVASLDVGLCPLLPTDWNRCRSDVKWLEYAAHGVAPVVSALEPYASIADGESGVRFASMDALGPALSRLLGDAALRERIARGARAAAERRLERLHAPARLAFYRRAAAEAGRTLAARAHPELAALGLDARDGPHAGSRYLPAPEDERTDLLHDGLVDLRDGRAGEARRRFAEAERLAPDDPLPPLYLGGAEHDPARALPALRRAVALAPESATAARALAVRLLAAGDGAAARLELERLAALAPELGVGDAALAELDLDGGAVDEGRARLGAAVERNPFLAPAAARLALEARAAGRAAEGEAVLRAALTRDGRAWQTRLALGRLLVDTGRPGQAVPELERALERADDPVPVMVHLARAHAAEGRLEPARLLLAEIRRRQGGG